MSAADVGVGAHGDGLDADDVVEEYVMTPLPVKIHQRTHERKRTSVQKKRVAACCDYDGSLGGIAKAVFRIYVLEDGILTGEVYELKTSNANSSSSRNSSSSVNDSDSMDASTTQKTPKRPKLSTSMSSPSAPAAAGSTATTTITTTAPLQERVEWVQIANLIGRAAPLRPYHRYHEPLSDTDTYCCYFDVSPYTSSNDGGGAFACHTHFTPQAESLSGHALAHSVKPFWITVDAPCELHFQEIKDPFMWTKRSASHEMSVAKPEPVVETETAAVTADTPAATGTAAEPKSELAKLYPLTPGLFEFRGFTTTAAPTLQSATRAPGSTLSTPASRRRRRQRRAPPAEPTKDECFVTLQLLPGGTLAGTSRELLRPQSCPVRGTWRADRVQYVLEYTVRDAVGRFEYSGRVDSARKIIGKWCNVDDDGQTEGYAGGKGEFELELTDAARLSKTESVADAAAAVRAVTRQRIRVLTTGVYTLKGCATDDDGYEYACELFVELLPGGKLRGTTRELVFDQTRVIRGRWTPWALTYTQVYIVKGDVGEYVYTGALDDDDGGIVRGKWVNTEEQDENTRGEQGTFAYGIVRAQRQWSRHSHACYPPAFRAGVHTVLLCSARTHALPLALWYRVFAFCHETWFAVA